MGGEGSAFKTLIGYLEKAIESFPDRRTGHNCLYTIRDAALSAFSVFHTQFPSFLSHQQMMQEDRGTNNAKTLYGISKIPTDTCIRILLDPVAPEYCFPVFTDVHTLLEKTGKLKQEYRTAQDTYLLALDGTWFHSSETIHCEVRSANTRSCQLLVPMIILNPISVNRNLKNRQFGRSVAESGLRC